MTPADTPDPQAEDSGSSSGQPPLTQRSDSHDGSHTETQQEDSKNHYEAPQSNMNGNPSPPETTTDVFGSSGVPVRNSLLSGGSFMEFSMNSYRGNNEDSEMMPYYCKQSQSFSRSERPGSGDPLSAMDSKFGEASQEIGLRYFTREPDAALNQMSGELKFNGKWSWNMSDTPDAAGRSGSIGRISLLLPDLGNGIRGSYSNSVSPLGLALTTPAASPRTAVAFTHPGFRSPHTSQTLCEGRERFLS